jgi:shikimate kinase
MNSTAAPAIVIIGLMGAGKTTIGRRLAQRLGWPVIDTDHEVERRCGAAIPVIFELEGEAGFRRREAKVIEEVMAYQGQVITTGGGAPMSEANQQSLKRGFVVYLDAEPRQLWQRLKSDQSRPLLTQSTDPRATLERLYQERDPVYRRLADLVVCSTRGSLGQVLTQIERALTDRGVAQFPPRTPRKAGHDNDTVTPPTAPLG